MKTAFFPVGITPTKFLTPSHLKGILQLDFFHKMSNLIGNADIVYNRRVWDSSLQTVKFWNFLDHYNAPGGIAPEEQESISDLYALSQSNQNQNSEILSSIQQDVLRDGYTHESSKKITEIWASQLLQIGVDSSYLYNSHRVNSLDETLIHLKTMELISDYKCLGGPVYMDCSDKGLSLRQLKSKDGNYNYLVPMIAMLAGILDSYDRIILFCDKSVEIDFRLIREAFPKYQAKLFLKVFNRVSLAGSVKSSKHGISKNYAFNRLVSPLFEHHSANTVKLGLRLYFLHSIPVKSTTDFDSHKLMNDIYLADKLISDNETQGFAQPPLSDTNLSKTSIPDSVANRCKNLDSFGILSLLKSKKTDSLTKKLLIDLILQ